jgi:3-hydroxyacyl-CoA dehydrogenase
MGRPSINPELLLRLLLVGYIGEFDAVVERKLVNILVGGAFSEPQTVSEQHVLDLEREAFVSLCGERNTQACIATP